MKKIVLFFFVVLLLASCVTPYQSPELSPVTIETPSSPLITNELVPMLPKIKTIDWQASLTPMVQQMLALGNIKDGGVLLVNTMKNATNGNLQINKATAVLNRLLAKSGKKFQVIGADKLNIAYRKLGISVDDNLESCSKAIGIARYLNALYVLYSAASGDVKAPILNLQLMLVQTGEIIWSYNGIAQKGVTQQ